MRQNRRYHYYVEGDCERKIISTLKTDYQTIIAGKVEIFNMVEKTITKKKLMSLSQGTTVILVFDTDTGKSDILDENIRFLKNQSLIHDVICVTQVENLEEELLRSCDIKEIKELTKSKSNKDFKRDLLRISNFKKQLDNKHFELSKFWNRNPRHTFRHITNQSKKIKK